MTYCDYVCPYNSIVASRHRRFYAFVHSLLKSQTLSRTLYLACRKCVSHLTIEYTSVTKYRKRVVVYGCQDRVLSMCIVSGGVLAANIKRLEIYCLRISRVSLPCFVSEVPRVPSCMWVTVGGPSRICAILQYTSGFPDSYVRIQATRVPAAKPPREITMYVFC